MEEIQDRDGLVDQGAANHLVGQLMASNHVVTDERFEFTRPSDEYDALYFWDGCCDVIILTRLGEHDTAANELRSLVASQLTDDDLDSGLIPHMNKWGRNGRDEWETSYESNSTQPPLIAYATKKYYEASRDRGLLKELYPKLVAYHDWIDRRITPTGSHIAVATNPWVTGWDASKRWDFYMLRNGSSDELMRQHRREIIKNLEFWDYSLDKVFENGSFVAAPVDFNAIRIADLEALAEIGEALGENTNELKRRAEQIRVEMRERMWSEQLGTYVDLIGPDFRQSTVESAAAFVTFFGGVPTSEQALKLEKDLFSPKYRNGYMTACTARLDRIGKPMPSQEPWGYWRDHTSLAVIDYLEMEGMFRYGLEARGKEIAADAARTILKHGFSEFHHSDTGVGLGAQNQSWDGLLVEFLFRATNEIK